MEENGKCTDPVPSGANNADERRLGKRPAEQFMRAPSHRQALPKLSYSAVKLQWEDFVEENSKVPTEYSSEILKVILSEIEVSVAYSTAFQTSNIWLHSQHQPLVYLIIRIVGAREVVPCIGSHIYTILASWV
jgi:hypothetical protein